jgi:hypothetical protein
LKEIVAELCFDATTQLVLDWRMRVQCRPHDAANLARGMTAGGGFLVLVQSKADEALRDSQHPSPDEKTAYPVVEVEREMVSRVERSDAFPEAAPDEHFRLNPLMFGPPDAIDVEHFAEI